MSWLRTHRVLLIRAAIALLSAGTLVVVIDGGDGSGTPPVTITVNAARGDGQPAATVTVPQAAVQQARPSLERDLQAPPSDTPSSQLQAAGEQAAQIKATQDPLPTAGASQGFTGCVTRFVVNQSSRHGVRPQEQVLHETVSRNLPGTADGLSIVALFNTPSFEASSNFVIDGDGNCWYLVPIEAKAWTQAAANPFAISYEIINTADRRFDSVYLAPPGLAKLRLVMREVAKRTGIPLRRGIVNGCTVVRTGIVQHRDFGICGGGHSDIAPFALDPIIAFVAKPDKPPTPSTKRELRIISGIAVPKGTGHTRRYWCRRDAVQRARLLRLSHWALLGKPAWGTNHRGQRYQLLARPYARGCR